MSEPKKPRGPKGPGRQHQTEKDSGVAVAERTETKLEKPRMYRVLLHNDDYTTMEFVVAVLREVFHHDEPAALRIMLHVHHNGMGVAGVFTHEVAESKVDKTMEMAKEAQYPLLCTMEPEE